MSAGLAIAATNITVSQINENQRWMKLYRKIYNLFLSRDMTHKNDFNTTISQLDNRLKILETNIAKAFTQINTNLNALITSYNLHTHALASPPAVLAKPSVMSFQPTGLKTVTFDVGNQTRNAEVLAWGEPLAPIKLD